MVRFICLEIVATGVFAFECFFKSRTSPFDHSRRLERAFFLLLPVFDFLSVLRAVLAMGQILDSLSAYIISFRMERQRIFALERSRLLP
jgi:hypothetical protein